MLFFWYEYQRWLIYIHSNIRFLMCVSFKTILTQERDLFTLRHMAKKWYGIHSRGENSSISCFLCDTYNAEEP